MAALSGLHGGARESIAAIAESRRYRGEVIRMRRIPGEVCPARRRQSKMAGVVPLYGSIYT